MLPTDKPLTDKQNEKPLKLKDGAYITLENMIVTGELEPGRWVSEAELVTLSGFGRAPVRSAIQRLSDQELLSVFPSKGAQVCPIDYTKQFRALEVRRVLEEFLTLCAVKSATAAQKELFSEYSRELLTAAKNHDQAALTEYDRKNLSLVLQIADNEFAAKPMMSIKGLARRFWILNSEEFGSVAMLAKALSKVSAAIAMGSEDEARTAVNELIDYIEEFTLSVIGYQLRK